MSKITKYECGLCHKRFDTPESTPNEVSGRNGKWHFFSDDVCGTCVDLFGRFIEERGGELKDNGIIPNNG